MGPKGKARLIDQPNHRRCMCATLCQFCIHILLCLYLHMYLQIHWIACICIYMSFSITLYAFASLPTYMCTRCRCVIIQNTGAFVDSLFESAARVQEPAAQYT